ncbi:hypothetical protein ACFL3F_02220 [Planctomycetota bacterium]
MSKETTDHPAQHRDDDDSVAGPRCPPKTHQFKPGQSGNPKPKSKCKPPKPAPMPPRWLNVIGSMIHGGMDFQAAMAESGYSAGYYKSNGHQIKQDARFRKAYKEELAKTKAKEEPRRAKRMRDLDNIIEDPDTYQRDRIAAIQLQGRMSGWLSETIRHETTDRQQLLDDAHKAEAARLAVLVLDTRALPDGTMSSRVAHSAVTKSVASKIVPSGTPDSDTKAELARAALDNSNSGSPEDVQGG